MEDLWLAKAKRLQALAATGLHFDPHAFDRERYEEIDAIAREMIARLGDVPLERLVGLPDRQEGYATPKIDVRAAVLREGRILLVQERSDDKWTMPGGFADIGLSASENAVKETWEEACLRVRATKLSHVRHRAKQAGDPDYLDFYKFYFLCEADPAADPAPGPETWDAAFCDPASLPPLSTNRTTEADIAEAFVQAAEPARPTRFD